MRIFQSNVFVQKIIYIFFLITSKVLSFFLKSVLADSHHVCTTNLFSFLKMVPSVGRIENPSFHSNITDVQNYVIICNRLTVYYLVKFEWGTKVVVYRFCRMSTHYQATNILYYVCCIFSLSRNDLKNLFRQGRKFVCLGFCAVSTIFQLIYGDSLQIHVSWTILTSILNQFIILSLAGQP